MPRLPRLLLFTDEAAALRHGRSVTATLARALDDVVVMDRGAVAVIVRAKQLGEAAYAERCRALRPIAHASGVRVFSHGAAALVGPLRLDGCHLPSTASPRMARLHLPPHAVLGVSAHPRHDGDVCAFIDDDGVDYATWSPIFSPASKADARPPLGLPALGGHRTPVIALGGVDATTARACLRAGARGVGVIGAVFGAARPDLTLRALLVALDIPHRRRHGAAARSSFREAA